MFLRDLQGHKKAGPSSVVSPRSRILAATEGGEGPVRPRIDGPDPALDLTGPPQP